MPRDMGPRVSMRRAAIAFGPANVVTASLIVFGVFVALPSRWWPVDAAATGLTAIEIASGVGLLLRARWGVRIARAAGAFALAVGLTAVSLLAVTASWLSGIYGPVGFGGAVVLAFVAALIVPYLVLLPLAQLWWLQSYEDAAFPGSG